MSKFIDITGKRYNNLVVVERMKNAPNGVTVWKCICDCGNTTIVRGSNLKNGSVKSCGCRKHNSINATHKMSKTRIYREWANMKSRCYCENTKTYKDYGGRGIEVCNEWKNSFENFRDWAYSNGYSDELTIERKDYNENYCPENCIWIPFNEQQRNRRNCLLFTHNGKEQNLTDWCNELNLPYKNVHNRIYRLGWSFERAISEPICIKKRNKDYVRVHQK